MASLECTRYKNKNGKIFQSPNVYKYRRNFTRQNFVYIQCVPRKSKEKCKGSARINSLTEKFLRLHPHNHDLNSYKTELYSLKISAKTNHVYLAKVLV